MWRTLFIALLVALAFDQLACNGRYTAATEIVLSQVLVHLR